MVPRQSALTPRELVQVPQAVNTNNIVSSSQAGSQVIGSPNSNNNNPQAVSINSNGASAVPSRQVAVPRQAELVP